MKKILVLGAVLALFTIAASAQQRPDQFRSQATRPGIENKQVTRGEKFKMNRDKARLHHENKRAHRNGKISRSERKKLHQMRHHHRRQAHRFHHNGRKRA